MKKIYLPLIIVLLLFLQMDVSAQFRKIPDSVTNALKAKYPEATNVNWKDKITNFTASFTIDGIGYDARFDSKGGWLGTQKTVNEDHLPAQIKDGLSKSKYATWEIKTVYFTYLPDKPTEYHIIVGRGDIERKHLLFDEKGRLLSDDISLSN